MADSLKHRLADLRAAAAVGDLLAGHPRPGNGPAKDHIVIDLCEEHRLVISANHVRNPATESGAVDWNKVGRIRILRIE